MKINDGFANRTLLDGLLNHSVMFKDSSTMLSFMWAFTCRVWLQLLGGGSNRIINDPSIRILFPVKKNCLLFFFSVISEKSISEISTEIVTEVMKDVRVMCGMIK